MLGEHSALFFEVRPTMLNCCSLKRLEEKIDLKCSVIYHPQITKYNFGDFQTPSLPSLTSLCPGRPPSLSSLTPLCPGVMPRTPPSPLPTCNCVALPN